ncbi:amino acid adenylation domain-containing protein [Gillisia sp. Hel_I_29]|uniref:non-ribosomal peptide synthetase n=1 Tax=Gillisia sp. Hel_I_29 TaxID=1249975 RepID=UPI0039777ECB
MAYPKGKTVVDLFESQVLKRPEAIAVVYEDERLSYGELNRRSNQLGHYLKERYKVKSGDYIGVMLNRSINSVVAMLSVMKLNCCYVPLDTDYPSSRLTYILKDSNTHLLITETNLVESGLDLVNTISVNISSIDLSEYSSIDLDLKEERIDDAFVIYTSGSTGLPKGVIQTHLMLSNLIQWDLNNSGIERGLCHLQYSSFSFDSSLHDIYFALSGGGKVCIVHKEALLDYDLLSSYILTHEIEVLSFPFAGLNNFYNELNVNSLLGHHIKHIVSTGEQLYVSGALQSFLSSNPEVELHNHYGPSETHVATSHTMSFQSEDLEHRSSIGVPISNTEIYILNREGLLQPVGVTGELYIAGSGLARGYLNNELLTKERFVSNPFKEGTRMYKTGDLGRWNSDGTITFLGREDAQVKIRGYRIELGEIESVLLGHADIDEAVVLANDNDGVKELVAYFVSSLDHDSASLRSYLKGFLPDYMLPSYYVAMDVFPLTPNGKIDRRSLPSPEGLEISHGVEYVAPETDTEKQLVVIWEDILGKENIGVKDDFFELGGHSLKATRLLSKLHKTFEVKLALKDLFVHTVLETQVSLLEEATKSAYVSIEKLEASSDYAISDSQRRLWVLSQFEGDSSVYNLPSRLVLNGSYDIELFKRAIYSVVDRHEILRTVFKENSQGEIRQWILERDALGFEIGELDLQGEADIESSVLNYLDNDRMVEFDLAKGPLLRAILLQVSEDRYVFYYNMHHIISDGWSMDVLSRDVFKYYEFYKSGGELDLPALRIQYKDYASWQLSQLSTSIYQGHRDYWTGLLGGDLPVLDLPSSKVRPVIQSHQGQLLRTYISKESTQGLKRFSHQEGGTLFMGLLSSLKALLYRYTGQEDLVVGTPVAGREHSDLEDQIGFYINTLALRNEVRSEDSFEDLFRRVRQRTLDAYEHQGYPFDRLVEDLELRRDTSRSAVFDMMLVLQNTGDAHQGIGISDSDVELITDQGFNLSKFDLSFTFEERGDYLALLLEYNTDVYEQEMLEGFIVHYKEFLEKLLSNPEALIGSIDYLAEEERVELLDVFNATAFDYPRDKTVVELFEEQVSKTPEAIAVVYEEERLSYEELNRRSNQLAHYLQAHYTIEPDDLVGIMLPRSSWMIVGILGILKSGGAYVPIDPDYPEDRIAYMLEDSKCKVLLDEEFLDKFNNNNKSDYSTDNLSISLLPSNLLYVIYTSGSTGKPKGVMIEHSGVINRIDWMWKTFNFKEGEVVLQKTTFTFDVSVWEIFLPLCWGNRMIICTKEETYSPIALMSLIEKHGVNSLHFVPSMFNSFLLEVLAIEGAKKSLQSVKRLIASGESLSIESVRSWYGHLKAPIYNLYGPTEASIDVTYHKTSITDEKISIGVPISNTEIYILNREGLLQPIGVTGEISIAGSGLARGYLNNESLTKERFVSNPFIEGTRMYKTGDLGIWNSDGTITFLGREDAQVKIRGYRIELGEIESVLLGHADIDEAVVLANDNDGVKELVAYFVSSLDHDSASLRSYLKGFLPDYMLPSYYVSMEGLPLTPNGKIDRRSLPSPEGLEISHGVEYVAPETDTEKQLVVIWEDILGKENIGVKDDFFELGGHSLKATRLLSKLHKTFDVKLALKDLFVHTVLETQVSLIEEATKSAYVSIEKLEASSDYAISDSQRRLWVLSQFEGGSSAYNMPSRLVLNGSYDVDLFKRAIYSVVDRHEILRTVFKENSQGEIRQWILERDALGFEIGELDLQGEADIESSVLRYLDNDRMVEFDLAKGPLLRAILLQVSEDRYVFYYNMHHIISDGWSMDVLSRDVFKYYEFYKSGGELDLPALRIQYKDYASWQLSQLSTSIYQGHRDYWTGLLGGDLPVLDLPSSKVRPVIQSHQGQLLRTYISKESTQGLKRFSHQEGGTLFMGLLSSLKALLYRYTGQEDLVVGTPVAGREHSDLEDQIGFYINTLALRNEVRSEDSFEDLFRRVRQRTLDAYEHQGYPFDRLVEDLELRRDTSRSAVFDMMLVLQNTGDAHQGIGISDSDVELITDQGFNLSKFDLSFTFEERGDYLALLLEYNTDVYEQEMLEGFIVHYKEFLEKLLSNPEALIGSIDYLAEEERVELLDVFNATAFDYPRDKTVVELFEEQVSKTPEAIAVVYEEERLSYEELNRRSNQLAHYLQAHYTIEPDDLVGIMLPRSSWMIVGILGILKSGGAYVPIDPDYPEDRIAYMLEDSKCKVLLDEEFLDKFNNNNKSDYSTDNLSISLLPSNLLYVIYTSGSTGKPKGVMIEHSNLNSFLQWSIKEFKNSSFDSMLFTTSICFDLSIFEIFYTLISGKVLEVLENGLSISKHLSLSNKLMVNTVPSVVGNLLLEDFDFSSISILNMAGEPIPEGYLSKLERQISEIRNLYGPSESTTYSTVYRIVDGQKISIGVPISNTEIYILNREGLLQPVGVTGEIYIAGSGLARGYLNNELLTKERFVSNPFKEGTRMYKTGDLGRWNSDGTITFLGREDAQVKIRGYRIELGEIESVLLGHADIDEAVVLANDNDGVKELVAYFVSSLDHDSASLRSYLKGFLPDYMLPSYYVSMEGLPLTPNGKIDRRSLPSPEGLEISHGVEYVAPETDTEKQLVVIWEDILGKENIGVKDDFFELGGHSLKIIKVAFRVQQDFGIKLDLNKLFVEPNIKSLAKFLETIKWMEDRSQDNNLEDNKLIL